MPGIYKGTQPVNVYLGTSQLAAVYSGTTKIWPVRNYTSYVGVFTATAETQSPYTIFGASHPGVTGGVSVTSPSNAVNWGSTIDNYGALAGIVSSVFDGIPKNVIAGAAGSGTSTMVQAFNGQSRNSYACGLKSFVTEAQGDSVNEVFIRVASDGTVIWSSVEGVTVTNGSLGYYTINAPGLNKIWGTVTINPSSSSSSFNGYTGHTLYIDPNPTTISVMVYNQNGSLAASGFCFSGFLS